MLVLYWPDGVLRQETIGSFIQAFSTKGYFPCNNGNLEDGFVKIALYALNKVPTHAARQLPDGNWTSKLGWGEDISHTIDALNGPVYGSAVLFLKKAI